MRAVVSSGTSFFGIALAILSLLGVGVGVGVGALPTGAFPWDKCFSLFHRALALSLCFWLLRTTYARS